MDQDAKKTALRMIPYGLYVLTGRTADGDVTAATVNWVTQASFTPPLVVVGVKADSHAFQVVRTAGAFALNVLGKGQNDVAFAFFKTPEVTDEEIGGHAYRLGTTGAPILEGPIAFVECRVTEIVEGGDHAVVIGEVVDAGVAKQPEGRADDATLHMRDLGERTFYGG
ncbi:MAG: flavin reductase family protein [Solirubrobacteraceae bacterium]|nr:flavin reductase family protein [Solirubrobacteraceae bacterium]